MSRIRTLLRLSPLPVLLSLGACVTPPPSGPSFVALPQDGKPYDRFLTEDNFCRQTAFSRSGYSSSTGANSTATGAVAGTLLGAGAGALLGAAVGHPGFGAAAGAGTGLVAGTAVGSNNAAYASGGVQQNYDATYAQCMASYGNKVPASGQLTAYPSYAAAYPAYGYGPGWGWGWGFDGLGWGGFYGPFYGVGFYRGYYGHGFYGGYHGGFHGGYRR